MTAAPATTTRYLKDKLRQHFGFRAFRPGQLEAVRSAMLGRDVLAVMPTGSGKSLCYQLPALELEGTTVVVSPLIALMKDQADHLAARGLAAAVVNSTLTPGERAEALERIGEGLVEFVFTTPEQLTRGDLLGALGAVPIDLFVVDEAHCVSQWGHDFRPDYLTLWEAVEAVGRPPLLALTASATPDVIDDILTRLHMPDAEVVHTGFYRPNIRLRVSAAGGDAAKRRRLVELLRDLPGTGIVYAATTKAVDELTDYLDDWGLAVAGYHGKMAAKKRAAAHDRFAAGELKALVATSAFGLGIDMPDIRFVAHYHLPGTVEAFYQEFGRAGRDGGPADGILLYDPADLKLQRFFNGGRYPDDADLVNTYHALTRVAGGPDAVPLAAIAAVCPVPQVRLKVCLQLLAAKHIAAAEPGGKFRLVARHLTRDDVARAAESYRERHERDQANLHRMAEYAEHRGCRWQVVLGHFAADPLDGPCGHCDNCR